jgi:hypothetical protein
MCCFLPLGVVGFVVVFGRCLAFGYVALLIAAAATAAYQGRGVWLSPPEKLNSRACPHRFQGAAKQEKCCISPIT